MELNYNDPKGKKVVQIWMIAHESGLAFISFFVSF
jgi:hypothetical protein